jgi:hypothetical protein
MKYKLIDIKMTIKSMFSLLQSDIWYKGSKDLYKVLFAPNTYIQYTVFFKNRSGCASMLGWMINTKHFSKGHRDLQVLLGTSEQSFDFKHNRTNLQILKTTILHFFNQPKVLVWSKYLKV